MKTNERMNFELLLKDELENYLIEDIDSYLDNLDNMKDPEYSEGHKKFVEEFFGKKKNKKNSVWRKWSLVAAVFLGCFVFFNHNITAEIKQIYNNIFIDHTEESMDLKKKTMYVEYNLNEFPESWETLFLPKDMIRGYAVEKLKGDKEQIEITFINMSGDRFKYILSKKSDFNYMEKEYEELIIDDRIGCYYRDDDKGMMVLLIEQKGISYIKIEAENMTKEDMRWILDNITCIYL